VTGGLQLEILMHIHSLSSVDLVVEGFRWDNPGGGGTLIGRTGKESVGKEENRFAVYMHEDFGKQRAPSCTPTGDGGREGDLGGRYTLELLCPGCFDDLRQLSVQSLWVIEVHLYSNRQYLDGQYWQPLLVDMGHTSRATKQVGRETVSL